MAKRPPAPHVLLERLRVLTATFPETRELETWGHPTFRVRDKIFASYGEHDGRPSISAKQTKPDQAVLVEDEHRFFVAPYVGKHGWVGAWIDVVDWPLIADLVERSYRLIAPKTLVKALDARTT